MSGSLADGTPVSFGLEVPPGGVEAELASTLATLRRREDAELELRIPKVMRRVAGYNLDRISRTALRSCAFWWGLRAPWRSSPSLSSSSRPSRLRGFSESVRSPIWGRL